jgi:hypothetical protein
MIAVGTEIEEIAVAGGIEMIGEWRDVMPDVMMGTGHREESGTCSKTGAVVVVEVEVNLTVMPLQRNEGGSGRRA